MKLNNLLANTFAQKSNQQARVGIALITGLAVGTALAMLFTPKNGEGIRRGINDACASLRDMLMGKSEARKVEIETERPYVTHTVPKRPKSDIKELIQEAHAGGQHTEQSIG